MFETHKESGIIGIGLDNFAIYVLDSETKTIIRKFHGHTAKLNDIAFSPDSRWLISASMDSTIKVWDIPSSYMIDHFKVSETISKMVSFSSTLNAIFFFFKRLKGLVDH